MGNAAKRRMQIASVFRIGPALSQQRSLNTEHLMAHLPLECRFSAAPAENRGLKGVAGFAYPPSASGDCTSLRAGRIVRAKALDPALYNCFETRVPVKSAALDSVRVICRYGLPGAGFRHASTGCSAISEVTRLEQNSFAR